MNKINKENVKSIVLDLDGTTLDDFGQVSDELVSIINKIKSQGILVFLASGRSYDSILPHYNKLSLSTDIVAYNGNQLVSPLGKVLKENFLNSLLVEDALRLSKKYNVYIQFYINKKAFYIGDENLSIEYWQKSGVRPIRLNECDNFNYNCTNGMFLVSETNCDNSSLLKIQKEINESSLWSHYGAAYLSSCGTLEFANKGISKGSMLSILFDQLNLDFDNTIAIGDGLNDKEMLERAYISVAMGNSSTQLKEIADITIKKNSENGVADFLNSIF